jgi:putative peptidoglycan lipid II flippase
VYIYAQAVMLLPYAVLAVPLATAAFPSIAGSEAVDAGRSRDGTGRAGQTLRRAWLATVVVALFGAAALVAVAIPVGSFFMALDAGSAQVTSQETLAAMPDAVMLLAPSVIALGIIGLLTRAAYVRGSAVLAGGFAAVGWLATTAFPLLVLDPSGAGGPTTLRALGAGTSLGLAFGALLLVVLVGRTWGPAALSVPVRPLLAAVVGATTAAVAGHAVGSTLSIHGVGHSLGGSLVVGLAIGVGALAVMVGLALAVDPSIVRRVGRARSGRTGIEGGMP